MQGISLSSLKSACRRLGVRRWPYSRLHGTNIEPEDDEQRQVSPNTLSSDEHVVSRDDADQGSSRNLSDPPHPVEFPHTSWPRLAQTEPRWLECSQVNEANLDVNWVCNFSRESARWLKHFLTSSDEYMSDWDDWATVFPEQVVVLSKLSLQIVMLFFLWNEFFSCLQARCTYNN